MISFPLSPPPFFLYCFEQSLVIFLSTCVVMPTLLGAGVHHALSLLCAYCFRFCPVACLLGEIPLLCDTGLHHYSSPLLLHVVLTLDVKTDVLKYIFFSLVCSPALSRYSHDQECQRRTFL